MIVCPVCLTCPGGGLLGKHVVKCRCGRFSVFQKKLPHPTWRFRSPGLSLVLRDGDLSAGPRQRRAFPVAPGSAARVVESAIHAALAKSVLES